MNDPRRIVATIGSERYSAAQLEVFLQERFPESSKPLPHNDGVLSELLDRAIDERLLLQAARSRSMTVEDQEVKEYLSNSSMIENTDPAKQTEEEKKQHFERAREVLLVNKYLQSLAPPKDSLSPTREREYYHSNLDQFQEPERYHIKEILVKDEPLAQAIEGMLARRKSFESLAQKYSKNPVASQGGDLGWFARGELPEQLERAVTALKPGQHSGIVKTDYGFHIFKLKEIQKSHQMPFEKARPQIRTRLIGEQTQETVNREISRLRKNTPITILFERLPFKYISIKPGI